MGYVFSRGYVYCFSQMFQGLRLFKGLRLFQSLEYVVHIWIVPYYGDSYAFCYWKVEKSSASSASMYEKSCENNVTLIFIICSHKMPNRIYDLEKESKLEEDWAKSLWPSQKTWTLYWELRWVWEWERGKGKKWKVHRSLDIISHHRKVGWRHQ